MSQRRRSWAQLAWELTCLYYDRLNRDQDFRLALSALFERLEATGVPPSFADAIARELWQEAEHGDPGLMREMARHCEGSSAGEYYRKAIILRQQMAHFLSRWPLPQDKAWDDLARSYDTYLRYLKPRGLPPELESAGHAEWIPEPGIPHVVGELTIGGILVRVTERRPWIFPSHPLPFLYDPLAHDRGWLEQQIEAICRDIRESILGQARLYEEHVESQGWRRLPPRLLPKAGEAIERLYLRLVKGLSWQQIAHKTGGDEAHVRRQVRYYARLLGLKQSTD